MPELRPVDGRDDLPRSVETFRHFGATLFSAAAPSVFEAIGVTIGLGLSEGIGLLLLVPLLGLVGIDSGQNAVSGIAARVTVAFGWFGIAPTLPMVLGVYVGTVAVQTMLQRREFTLSAKIQHEVIE